MAGKCVDIVFRAGRLARLPPRREDPASLEMNRLRIEFRIFDQQLQVEMAEIRTGPTLHDVPSVAELVERLAADYRAACVVPASPALAVP